MQPNSENEDKAKVYLETLRIDKYLLRDYKKTSRRFLGHIHLKRPATLLKKRLWHRCFPVNFVKFLRTPFLQNTSGRLLLCQNDQVENLYRVFKLSSNKARYKTINLTLLSTWQ